MNEKRYQNLINLHFGYINTITNFSQDLLYRVSILFRQQIDISHVYTVVINREIIFHRYCIGNTNFNTKKIFIST